jgi:UDP-glucose 4-epimerase
MNVLLTGGMGYIGSHTAVILAEAGYEVVLYDNLCNSSVGVIDSIEAITGKHLPFIKGDIRDTVLLTQILRVHQIDAVIHFAGLKAVAESVAKPIDYYANNVAGTISLLQALRAADVNTLVFSSSAAVYGDPQYLPIDEEHPTSATNPYARSKLHIEDMLADVVSTDGSWRIVCLRYFNPVGAHESGLIGENPAGIPNNLMPYMAQVAAGKFPHINVFGNDYPTPDGTGVRDYIHVMDLAEGHLLALNFLATATGWHAINVGTGRGYSVLEMIMAFELASGQSVPYKISSRRPGDIAACYAKAAKAAEQLNWQANRTLEEMCVSGWRYQIRNFESDWRK